MGKCNKSFRYDSRASNILQKWQKGGVLLELLLSYPFNKDREELRVYRKWIYIVSYVLSAFFQILQHKMQ